MKILAIAGVNLRRLFRDRTNIFFVIISPLLFLFVLGLLFGGGQPLQLGVAGAGEDPMAQRLLDTLERDDRVEVVEFTEPDELLTRVERGNLHAGLLIPADYGPALREGGQAELRYLAQPDNLLAAELGVWVRSVIPHESSLLRAAQLGQATGEGGFDAHLEAAESTQLPPIEVEVSTTGEQTFPPGLSQFAPIAPSLLLLFVFLTSLTAALGLIQARRIGVITRMFASPTPVWTIVAGEALGRLAIALLQGLVVILGSAVLFGVDWGDPLGAAAVLLLFCLVGSGAAMVVGALFRNEGPALGVAMILGLGLAAVGGAMVPLEQLSEPVQQVARFTPHAWGYEAYSALVRSGASIGDIGPELGVLAGFAVVLFGAGALLLRRTLSS